MKKLVGLTLALMLLAVPAWASSLGCDGHFGSILNKCVEHPTFVDTDTVYEMDNPLGVGANVTVFESDAWYAERVYAEGRFDLVNDEQSVFLVADINAYKFLNKLFKKK